MACTPATYQNSGLCQEAEVVATKSRVWYANYDAWIAAKNLAVPEIVYTQNAIDTFIPTDPILYELNMGVKFDSAPTDTNAVTTSGLKKYVNSVILQVLDNSLDADLQKALFNVGRFVIIIELEGMNGNPEDAFKVYGSDLGLTLVDGASVENANADNGQALLTFTSDTEDGHYESYPRRTIADGLDYVTRLAAIEAAVVPAV